MTPKAKKEVMYLVFSVAIIFALYIGLEIGHIAGKQSAIYNLQTANKSQMEEQLINWVYSKSERISKDTCKVIVQEAMKTKYPLLMLALVEMESNFIPSALSSKGAIGLTQVIPKYHRRALIKAGIIVSDRDLFNIGASIRAGDMILREYLKTCNNDVAKALEKYLGGRDGIYVKRILSNLSCLYIVTAQ